MIAKITIARGPIDSETLLLRYRDEEGEVEVLLKKSLMAEFEWIASEKNLKGKGATLDKVIECVNRLPSLQGEKFKIFKDDEIGT